MNVQIWKGGVDFFSGLLLVGISVVALWFISDLDLGTARRMGPGFFPLCIALVVAAMGLFLAAKGLLVDGPAAGRLHARPMLLVLLSVLAFALLVDRAGLIVAILVEVAIASFASRESSLRESLLFGALLAVLCVIVFIWLLGMPLRILP